MTTNIFSLRLFGCFIFNLYLYSINKIYNLLFMASIEDIKLSANAYFYKLREGMSFSAREIRQMLREVTSDKQRTFLLDCTREGNPREPLYSIRIFKNKPSTPSFIQTEEGGWKEQKIGYYLFVEYKNYVAILKKYASIPKNVADKLENIDYNTLLSLHANNTTKFQKMSLQNLDGSDHAMRNKSYESLNLSENVPTLGASRYYVRTVKGVNGNDKFALTLYSSRVNGFHPDYTITQICSWVKQTIELIMVNAQLQDSFLSIFAKPENYAAQYKRLIPKSVLIFYSLLVQLKDEQNALFYKKKQDGTEVQIDNASFDRYINQIAKAFIDVDQLQTEDNDKTRYFCGSHNKIEIVINKSGIRLKNKTWDRIFVSNSPYGEYDDTLSNIINKYNQFNIYFSDSQLIYSNKKLFRDTRLVSGISQFLKVLHPMTELENSDCEKHTQQDSASLNEWGANSVFKIVEDHILPIYRHVICDDYGDEWADHIAIDDDVVAFFVSKHRNNSENSASAFQDAVGQALKNLGNMNPTKEQLNTKRESWERNYLHSNILRLRSNNSTVQEALDLWGNNISSPNFRREMCLVVNFMSKSLFESQLGEITNGGHPTHEASIFQRLWLLSSFVNGCLEYGVTPKIYCKS